MVTKITFPKRLIDALRYNEQKVDKGKAECLWAENYLLPVRLLDYHQKLEGLQLRNQLNDRATTKTFHGSINFDPSESFSREQLIQMVRSYMNRIGFGDQPYLVYQHLDAGHPHLHVVSTTIRADGTRIPTHNLGRNQSEKARMEIEQAFDLRIAQNKKRRSTDLVTYCAPSIVRYGKTETKQGITQVLNAVLDQFHYSSLQQFNALLRTYNITADRGKPGSQMYQRGGLVYRVLDERGQKTGVPIKASIIQGKPTLPNLEQKFRKGSISKKALSGPLRETIDMALSEQPSSFRELVSLLKKTGIACSIERNSHGLVTGITYIDHQNQSVFDSAELGLEYGITALQRRLGDQHNKMIDGTGASHTISTLSNGLMKQEHSSEKMEYEVQDSLLQRKRQSQVEKFQLSQALKDQDADSLLQKKRHHPKRGLGW